MEKSKEQWIQIMMKSKQINDKYNLTELSENQRQKNIKAAIKK